MSNQLTYINILSYVTESGVQFENILLSYELFGRELGTAPVIMVNHALTGNSSITGEYGWWNDIVGDKKVINTEEFTVLCFNIPGNGYDGFILDDYKSFIARDIARIFLLGLDKLNITQLYALIGGSLGGGIAWEMAILQPNITQYLIPIATDWKSSDWLIANCKIQELLLLNSKNPVHDARIHAMLCYRSPESFKLRFNRSKNENLDLFNVESWLLHHGKKLEERYQFASYRLMNQLLKTIDASNGSNNETALKHIQAEIHMIGIDSDLFFPANENIETYQKLSQYKANVFYHEIHSVHGHDAFLIEHKQVTKFLQPVLEGIKQ